jgi:hypothetical protein
MYMYIFYPLVERGSNDQPGQAPPQVPQYAEPIPQANVHPSGYSLAALNVAQAPAPPVVNAAPVVVQPMNPAVPRQPQIPLV